MTLETKDKPRTPGVPPAQPGQSSENKVTPKTYSEADYLKAVSDERAISGRFKSDLEKVSKERDTFKSEAAQTKAAVEEATSTLEETKGRIAELEADLETALEGNPTMAEVQRIKRELKTETDKAIQQAKVKEKAADELIKVTTAERESNAADVAEAREMKAWRFAVEVAEEYEGGDHQKLKAKMDEKNLTTKEDAEWLAGILWTKKTEPKGPGFISDSGVTNGSSEDLNSLSTKELLRKAYAKRK